MYRAEKQSSTITDIGKGFPRCPVSFRRRFIVTAVAAREGGTRGRRKRLAEAKSEKLPRRKKHAWIGQKDGPEGENSVPECGGKSRLE